jgi:hypothetical protein
MGTIFMGLIRTKLLTSECKTKREMILSLRRFPEFKTEETKQGYISVLVVNFW